MRLDVRLPREPRPTDVDTECIDLGSGPIHEGRRSDVNNRSSVEVTSTPSVDIGDNWTLSKIVSIGYTPP